jgi:2-iminobutanoate/2-iminopropanoate deaminase
MWFGYGPAVCTHATPHHSFAGGLCALNRNGQGFTGVPTAGFRHLYQKNRVLFSPYKEGAILNPATKKMILLALIFGCGVLLGALYTMYLIPPAAHPVKNVLSSKQAPEPIGPYSQGVRAGDLVFLSGQIGLDPATGTLSGDAEAQTTRAMENLKAVLAASGLSFSDVVQTRIYLVNMSDFAAVNKVYGTYFNGTYPSRSTVQVAGLPKGALVEIEMVAQKR